jgi:hypothetical protein
LEHLAPAFEHHYRCNSHHPEHYGPQGVSGMDLFDLVEMVCDWMAASKRNPQDGVKLAYNVELFGIQDQLAAILANTLARWPERHPDEPNPVASGDIIRWPSGVLNSILMPWIRCGASAATSMACVACGGRRTARGSMGSAGIPPSGGIKFPFASRLT